MGLRRVYWRTCDHCNTVCNLYGAGHDTPRQALAEAKRQGWQRRQVQVGSGQRDAWDWNEKTGKAIRLGRKETYAIYAMRDLCPACADKLDKENA